MTREIKIDSKIFCRKIIQSRSKFSKLAERRCHKLCDHKDKCEEFPFLRHLKKEKPKIANKIVRDSMMTTGAAWKSDEAGPNRILRWVMLETDENLLEFDIDMKKLQPQVVDKLREKAADYDSCVKVAMALTFQIYQMNDALSIPPDIKKYLERMFGKYNSNSTNCVICLLPLCFKDFDKAQRGKAVIETCHKNPRYHTPENVGFGHRECNIAQGGKTLSQFYEWISGIEKRRESK